MKMNNKTKLKFLINEKSKNQQMVQEKKIMSLT